MIAVAFSMVIFVVAFAAIVVGLCLWHTPHNIFTSLALGLGALVLVFLPPWILTYATNATDVPAWYADIMGYLRDWAWILGILVGIFIVADGVFALFSDWSVSKYGIPTKSPGTGAQRQIATFCFLVGPAVIALFTVVGIFAIQRRTAPKVDAKYVELKDKLESSRRCLGDLRFLTYDPLTFELDATNLPDAEIQRWISKLESEFKAAEGGSILKVDKIHRIQIRINNGKEIDQYIVGFDGRVDNPDPKKIRVLNGKTYPINVHLTQPQSMKWVDDELRKCSGTFVPPSPGTAPTSPTPSSPTASYFEPPRSCPFGTL